MSNINLKDRHMLSGVKIKIVTTAIMRFILLFVLVFAGSKSLSGAYIHINLYLSINSGVEINSLN